jgi:hypothetical protein
MLLDSRVILVPVAMLSLQSMGAFSTQLLSLSVAYVARHVSLQGNQQLGAPNPGTLWVQPRHPSRASPNQRSSLCRQLLMESRSDINYKTRGFLIYLHSLNGYQWGIGLSSGYQCISFSSAELCLVVRNVYGVDVMM